MNNNNPNNNPTEELYKVLHKALPPSSYLTEKFGIYRLEIIFVNHAARQAVKKEFQVGQEQFFVFNRETPKANIRHSYERAATIMDGTGASSEVIRAGWDEEILIETPYGNYTANSHMANKCQS